jgi:two-component system OmpR family response regulator
MEPFPSNICIIDDDADFVRFLADYLRLQDCQCTVFGSAEDLMRSGNYENYDFFIVDLGLPGVDGVDLTTVIRARSKAGILIVSGRLGADAFNSSLDAGADMFINKPIRFDQVLHAIKSILRRYGQPEARIKTWSLSDDLTKLISPVGHQVMLSPVEGRLLSKLHQNQSKVLSRVELAQECEAAGIADHRNLDAAFFRLRRKIERDAGGAPPLRTVRGEGYQWADDLANGAKGSIPE